MTLESESDRLDAAVRSLAAVCPVMAAAVRILPDITPMRRRANDFSALARTITFQQISTSAGLSIWRRLEERFAPISAETIGHTLVGDILSCGFSRQKASYLKNIAAACAEGQLDFGRLAAADDDAARAELVSITGIGPWTADIYLMFSLGRMDVFPGNDIALMESYRRLADLDHRPTPAEMADVSLRWRPWRSVAAHLLWLAYRSDPAERTAW